jgi:membrane fusion protein, multidrug efflux system
MPLKLIGIGLMLLGLVWAGVVLVSHEGRSPRQFLGLTSSTPSTERDERPAKDEQGVSVHVVPVQSQTLDEIISLPGELLPFLSVDLSPKITGIVESVNVDRGTMVKKGEVLIQLVAPELHTQSLEAESRLRAAEISYARLQKAASTPGIVAGNELELAQHNQEALEARLHSLQEMENYLEIQAPFDGMITERNIHPGAVVGPDGEAGKHTPLLRLEQVSHLRLIVPVPEIYTGSIVKGATVTFTVPAYPQETFSGVVARISQSIDHKTRSMPCEIDVMNKDQRLAAGMFPEVQWPVRRPAPTLFVPTTAVVTTTEDIFVLRVKENLVEWVSVRKGSRSGSMMEVFGALHPGDLVVARGTEEIRPGTRVSPIVKE